MHYPFTRMASFVLAFGLFIGCSTISSTENKSSLNESPSLEKIEQELETVNDSLQESHNSKNPGLYYKKGYLLGELAQKEREPTDRRSIYREMERALNKAKQLAASSGSTTIQSQVDEYLNVRWSQEHNQGVKIIQSDSSTLSSSDYQQAAAHFTNAIVIIPDSSISYNMKAQALYRNHQLDDAITVLERASNHIDPLPSTLLEQLAFLYLEAGQKQKAVETYEEAESFSDENLNIIHGLANAYINIEDHEKAVELLTMLVETEPENIVYVRTLGSELYFLAAQKVEQTVNSQNKLTKETYQNIHRLFNEAEHYLQKVLNSDSDNAEHKQKLAYFYNNSAAHYQRLLPYVPADYVQETTSKIKEYLQSSVPLLESLTQHDPDKKSLWKNLYRTYNYLGLDDKAEDIEFKINR